MTLAKPLTEYSFVLLVVFILSSFNIKSPIKTYTISIKITNIRNNKGFIQLQLYRSQKTFELETPYKTIRISKQNVTDKTLLYQIKGIAPSNYGIALLDDENGIKKWITDGYIQKRDLVFQTTTIQDGPNQLFPISSFV